MGEGDLDGRVAFVGRLRGDAAVYDPRVPVAKRGKRGPKAKKGRRLPSPRQAAGNASRKRTPTQPWCWRPVTVTLYGVGRQLKVVSYAVVWPRVLGLRPIQIVVVRDPSGRLDDVYLFSNRSPGWQ